MTVINPKGVEKTRNAMVPLMSLSTLYAFMYCMLVSNELVSMPIFGGALYMSGRVAVIFAQTFTGEARKFMQPKMRTLGIIMLVVTLLLNLFLLAIFPITLDNSFVWILFTIVFAMLIRGIATKRLIREYGGSRMTKKWFLLWIVLCHVISAVVVLLVLTYSLPAEKAWLIFGGFVLSAILEIYSLGKDREESLLMDEQTSENDVQATITELQNVRAFSAYQSMYTLILVALQVTLVMMYTFIAVSEEEILACMAISLICTLAAREVTDLILKRTSTRRNPDPGNVLMVGLFLWLYGLVLFYRQLSAPLQDGAHLTGFFQYINAYISLAFCSCGATVCVTCLAGMERDMGLVAKFSSKGDLAGYRQMRYVANEFAVLLGQMIALGLLTALSFVRNQLPDSAEALARAFQPLLVVPALLLVVGAILAVLHFPLTKQNLIKLQRFIQLKESGQDNPQLEKQLETVVIKKHKRRYGIKVIMSLVRPFYRHKLIGKENVPEGQDGRLIFICNHGELYGPVVTNLYMPFYFRPWSISDMMEDPQCVAEYLYRFTVKRQKWLPEFLKWPVSRRILAPLSIWLMRSIGSIPVYRNKPRELMNTFRISVEAMQAEDNLLIFPENPDAESLEKPGYVRSGVGEFFTGFTMLAPLYYNKTGKNVIFIPIYASKTKRTITIGEGIEYDPDNQPTEEKLRIVDYLRDTMTEIGREQGDY